MIEPRTAERLRQVAGGALTVAVLLTIGLVTVALFGPRPAVRNTAAVAPARTSPGTTPTPTPPPTASPGTAASVGSAPAIGPGSTSEFSSVSCSGPSWCMAVGTDTSQSEGQHALAMTWDGSTWQLAASPAGDALTWVSCSSSAFCMAAGGPTGAQAWNGTAWRLVSSPRGGAGGVSCGSDSVCMTIADAVVQSWNGQSWHSQSEQTSVCSGAPGACGLASVACGSASNCVAVGTSTTAQEPVQVSAAVGWNGIGWNRTSPPDDGNPALLNLVSCAGTFCMAAGGAFAEADGGGIATASSWDAVSQTWTDVSPRLGTLCPGQQTACDWATSLSCASATNCMTLGGQDGGQWWDGAGWQPARTISAGYGSALQSVSCGGSDCLAVGYRTIHGTHAVLAERWNGSAWTIVPEPAI